MSQSNDLPEIGTEEWLIQTGGRLTFRQAISLSTQGSLQVVRDRLTRFTVSPNDAKSQAARVNVARSELASVLNTQRDRVLTRQGEALLHHACRTYLLGAALLSDEVFRTVNYEVAAVASLAHDDGMVNPAKPGQCFTAASASEVSEMMLQLGASASSAREGRAAVISHFQPILPKDAGPTAQMVAAGASADVMGVGLKGLSPSLLAEIWQEWPDSGFIPAVRGLLKGEISRAPLTRPGVLALSGMPYLLRPGKKRNLIS